MESPFRTFLIAGILVAGGGLARADWRDQIGYTRLQLLAGSGLPAAPAAGFSHVEASLSNTSHVFEPDTTRAIFSGKTFIHRSGASEVSGHAQEVATYFYANSTSLVSGDCPIDLYLADTWLESDFLKTNSSNLPATQARAVENHSWISTDDSDGTAEQIGRRLDLAINRDGFVCVVGVNNGNSTTLPILLCQSYHTISVGLSNGNHSAGITSIDGAGRIKPDIVAPADYTSFSTPMVASAAGLLYAKLASMENQFTAADRPRVIKALLLASATRNTVAAWANSPAIPLDVRYGAGELNINHAYNDLTAGRVISSASSAVNSRGWSAESIPANSTKTYFFTIAAGPPVPFGAALTWHRQVTSSPGFPFRAFTSSLANLNLRLHQANQFTVGAAVSESLSAVDNVELISQGSLPPGDYALVVENLSVTATPYALAWHTLPVVTAVATVPVASETDGLPAQVTISRTGDTTSALYVPITVAGAAVAGTDFQAIPSSVVIPAGQTWVVIPVTPIPDNVARGNRVVSLGIGTDFALVNDPMTAEITLRDKPFDLWRFEHFTTAELADQNLSGANSDPDRDGLPNLIEYALGTDPQLPGVSTVVAGSADGFLTLTAEKNIAATDVVWTAEISEDLAVWEPAEIVANSVTTFEARDPIPRTEAGKRFIRLKISRP